MGRQTISMESDFKNIIERSIALREKYHELEVKQNGSEWTAEQDALGFLTDAGLVGRLTMSQQGTWRKGDRDLPELKHKLGECNWWLAVLAHRMDIDLNEVTEEFLTKTEKLF